MWETFQEEILPIWLAGGWLMIPLAVLGLMIYLAVFELYIYLARRNFYRADPNTWGHWVDVPADAEGELGEIIRFTQADAVDSGDIRDRFEEVRQAYLPPVKSRIRFANILTGAAPLMGLLGTVMGMLSTFVGLSVSTAGNTIDLVAGGISEALITTQTGLILAIPAYVFLSSLRKNVETLSTFLSRLETITILRFQRRQGLAAKAGRKAAGSDEAIGGEESASGTQPLLTREAPEADDGDEENAQSLKRIDEDRTDEERKVKTA